MEGLLLRRRATCVILFSLLGAFLPIATAKSTIEPCSDSNACTSLVGYTLYTDLKVSEVAAIFSVDPIALILTNAVDVSFSDVSDVENYILPSQLFLKIPIPCACVDGIRRTSSVVHKTRPSDTLSSISATVYGGLVSAAQIREANPDSELSDPSVIGVGTELNIPLPCTCYNNSDNNLPAVYMSYVVREADTLAAVAARYATTVSDLMNVNALGNSEIEDGDILAIPISACASSFPSYASDYGLVVPNGSYAITASHCVQCSCGPGSRDLKCMPASLAVSCSSMECTNSNLMLGNTTIEESSGGCSVASCTYTGFISGSIGTTLSTSLQPKCPEPQQFPILVDPPTLVRESLFSPTSSLLELGGVPTTNPRSHVVPSTGTTLAFPPENGPGGSAYGSTGGCSSISQSSRFPIMFVLGLVVKFVSSIS